MADEAKEIQLQEVEALESIYISELQVLSCEYPNICLQVTISLPDLSNANSESPDSCILEATLPADYPNVIPSIKLIGIEEGVWKKISEHLYTDLINVAKENLGMSMIFTLVSELQEKIEKRMEEERKKTQQIESHNKEMADKAEQIHFEGTRVTVEQFNKWKQAFVEEMMAKKDAELKAKEAMVATRLTGKQLFLRDDSLNFSDLQFTNESAGVDIDESLFEDDIDISEEDSD